MRLILTVICLIFFCLPVKAEVVRVSLDEAVQLTLRNNLDLQAKRKELNIANAEIKMLTLQKTTLKVQTDFKIRKFSQIF